MQNRRAGRQRFNGVEDRRQGFVFDVNFFQRALRRAQIFGDNHGDEIAIEAHFVDGNKILIVSKLEMLMGRDLESRIGAVEMIAVDDAQDSGHVQRFGRIDAQNSRVGVRAQQRRAVRRVRQIRQIFDVLRPAGDFVFQVDARRGVGNFGSVCGAQDSFRFSILDSISINVAARPCACPRSGDNRGSP